MKLNLSEETLRALGVLGDPKEVLERVAGLVATGINEPDSWQRAWLMQAHSDAAQRIQLHEWRQTESYRREMRERGVLIKRN
jgi:hypothetical protein